ncbi:MAG: hypothetical protein HC845_08995 [Akkermansiaceae bacterium]|nr:hypothetical protein [Akkermansiaceae bacterium]
MNRLHSLTEKQRQLQALRPLEPSQVRALEEKVIAPFELEVIATSNQIEGNSLTLRETEMVLSKGRDHCRETIEGPSRSGESSSCFFLYEELGD